MKKYTYYIEAQLDDESKQPIYHEGVQVGFVKRVYSNTIKKLLDRQFDFRYFVIYTSEVINKRYTVKKIFRRGKLWFEGHYEGSKQKTIITYENWRIGIPELKIIDPKVQIKIEKEMEEPSRFLEGDQSVAVWYAQFDEQAQRFFIQLEISEAATIQEPAFYIAISQATLFIGA